MRILHVYKDYAPVVGGIENHMRDLCEALAARGHQVTALVTAPGRMRDDGQEGGVRILRAARFADVASTPLSLDLWRRLAAERPDVTHLHLPYPVAELAWLVRGRRPMVVTYHSDIVRQRLLGALWSPGLRLVLDRADNVLVGSPSLAGSSPFLRSLGDKVRIVPFGVDVTRFTLSPEQVHLARQTHRAAAPDARWVVFVGRLRYYKGLDVLIDALPDLDGVHVLVAGDGPMGQAWRERAKERNVADRMHWLGHVPDDELAAVYAAGDAYVLPAAARSEAFGIAMAEAMAAGLPVVSTELGTGTSWVNQHGTTGLVVDPGNSAALADGLRALLGDEEQQRTMAAAATERARTVLSRSKMVDTVEAIYADLVKSPAASR